MDIVNIIKHKFIVMFGHRVQMQTEFSPENSVKIFLMIIESGKEAKDRLRKREAKNEIDKSKENSSLSRQFFRPKEKLIGFYYKHNAIVVAGKTIKDAGKA